jgi:DNA-binding MarR family transcriptional regulator
MSPEEPDFALLVTIAARAVSDGLLQAHAEAGFDWMKAQYGFVLRALGDEGLGLTELAERLGISKQAALQIVDEMESHGAVRRRVSSEDRRAKVIEVTEKGQTVRSTALRASRGMETRLRRVLGSDAVHDCREVLTRIATEHGGADDARSGRARPVW